MALSAQQPAFDIQPLLRPSERVTVNLPCRVRTEQLSYTVAEVAVVLSRTPGFEEAAWVWSSSALNMILIFISIFVVLPPISSIRCPPHTSDTGHIDFQTHPQPDSTFPKSVTPPSILSPTSVNPIPCICTDLLDDQTSPSLSSTRITKSTFAFPLP